MPRIGNNRGMHMEGLGGFTLADPLLALAFGLVAGVVLVIGWQRLARRQRAERDPVAGFLGSDAFEQTLDRAATQSAIAERTGAVVRGRVHHLSQVNAVWGHSTRAEALAQVAQVMRAGVRKGDDVVVDAEADGAFAIHSQGADADGASAIARRLLDTLAQTPIPAMGKGARGKAAIEVSTGEWEEIRLLPAPSPSAANSEQQAG